MRTFTESQKKQVIGARIAGASAIRTVDLESYLTPSHNLTLSRPNYFHTDQNIAVSQSGPYRRPGGVEEMQGGGRRVRLEWGAYITV
ncbi:hypothetical protein FHG87_002281 [Trinorchestia longiramus]|nr:hypothetical protein FHG87_002281 [Trinorchestia longiramus]